MSKSFCESAALCMRIHVPYGANVADSAVPGDAPRPRPRLPEYRLTTVLVAERDTRQSSVLATTPAGCSSLCSSRLTTPSGFRSVRAGRTCPSPYLAASWAREISCPGLQPNQSSWAREISCPGLPPSSCRSRRRSWPTYFDSQSIEQFLNGDKEKPAFATMEGEKAKSVFLCKIIT